MLKIMKLTNLIYKANKRLLEASTIIVYRRLNWVFSKKKIKQAFQTFVNEFERVDSVYGFYVREDCETRNENGIELRCNRWPKTDLKKTIIKENQNPNIFESGGSLLARQTPTGHVIFIFYPLRTEKNEPSYKDLIISDLIEPNQIDSKFIKKMLERFLLLIRQTSLVGSEKITILERIHLYKIFLFNVRELNKLKLSLFEWKYQSPKFLAETILTVVITQILINYLFK